MPANNGYWNTQAAFYRDLGAYRGLLETPGCLRWDVAFTLIGGLGDSRVLGGGSWGGTGNAVSGVGQHWECGIPGRAVGGREELGGTGGGNWGCWGALGMGVRVLGSTGGTT